MALVRDAVSLGPTETVDQAREWAMRVRAAVEHRDEEERIRLIGLLARMGSFLAFEIPEPRRELFLSLMAGVTDGEK